MNDESDIQGGERSALKRLVEYAMLIALMVVIVSLLHIFVFAGYRVPTGSMENTVMVGDQVISEKVSYYLHSPERGDIVTFRDPLDNSRTLVKRVVAVEGQAVDLVDGKVVVDGIVLDEPYVGGRETNPLPTNAPGMTVSYPYTVPAGCIWLMGDNRANSLDSRYFGAVSLQAVTGRAAVVYWPLSRFKFLS